jgi:hypothetical protein
MCDCRQGRLGDMLGVCCNRQFKWIKALPALLMINREKTTMLSPDTEICRSVG